MQVALGEHGKTTPEPALPPAPPVPLAVPVVPVALDAPPVPSLPWQHDVTAAASAPMPKIPRANLNTSIENPPSSASDRLRLQLTSGPRTDARSIVGECSSDTAQRRTRPSTQGDHPPAPRPSA